MSTLDLIAASLRADAATLSLVAQNVANANSVAYLRQVPVTHAPYEQVAGGLGTATDSFASQPNTGTTGPATALDLRPGPLRSTSDPLHVALETPGFFVVDSADGPRLTRRGDFRTDAQGRLVTADGDPVSGTSGDLQISGGTVQIATDGTVSVDGSVAGKLRIVEVGNAADLEGLGGGMYRLRAGEDPPELSTARVRQGFLETSNVQPASEMLQLMETMRHFEAGQRFVQGLDDMLAKTLSTLGRI